jgi:DNA-binding NtrC family response regulator
MMRPKLLIVDDEPNMCRSLAIALSGLGDDREVDTAKNGEEALAKIDEATQVVICDLSMPGIDGIEVLRRLRARGSEARFILMTAYSTVQSAVEAMKLGAYEYLIKPFTNEELVGAVDGALAQERPSRAARELRAQAPDRLGDMVGRSEPMQKLFRLVERAAESDATVLVTGESGTGKELIARAVHTLSRRREQAFVAVNCAALTETLLESEIFGHEKGAFTGAHKTKIGRLEQADGGTLFLDEVGEMSLGVQTKLLRALESRSFERVGGLDTIKVDLRVVAATNRDLEKAIKSGRFREDLFYRLAVVTLHAPPLRERGGDIPLLGQLFCAEKAAELGLPPRSLSSEALAALASHPFPGNVRELENLIERAIVFADHDVLGPQDLPLGSELKPRQPPEALVTQLVQELVGASPAGSWVRLSAVVKDLERQVLERAISLYGDRPNEEIARLLGTSRRVLELRLAEFTIEKKR